MASLDRNLRRDLENAVKKARRIAEAGARHAVEQLAVGQHEPWSVLSPDQRKLRNRLRAHGRQLGDKLDEKKGTQSINRLASECAYEHWHRLLFARFLAENDLLVEPQSGMALSLDECRELAREQSKDWLVLASDFAQRMLPQIFRAGDPVLELALPPEKRQELEAILEGLRREVFIADDSLGWVYQFWQADKKDAVNDSEEKIDEEGLPAVTQLFTEDYMVLFLLHNTLGAWWLGKELARDPSLSDASTEDELRARYSLEGVTWEYLRCVGGPGKWQPAAGTFPTWPRLAKNLTVLDPCMGSGHFLVFALPILAQMRAREEGVPLDQAVDAVLRENLHGVEIDPRCTQIGAFSLALAAWRLSGYRTLPPLNIACAGIGIHGKPEQWVAVAGANDRAREAMTELHTTFSNAPILGSLIDPSRSKGNLLVAGFDEISGLLRAALEREPGGEVGELAVAAQGLAFAAQVLSKRFVLVITNVPYLIRRKQDSVLAQHLETYFADGAANLATAMVLRCMDLTAKGGTTATVSPQAWLQQRTYKVIRESLLKGSTWSVLARLGPGAFETITGEIVNVILAALTKEAPRLPSVGACIDAASGGSPALKAELLRVAAVTPMDRAQQLRNPDARVLFASAANEETLASLARPVTGIQTGDYPRFVVYFWEVPFTDGSPWVRYNTPPSDDPEDLGQTSLLRWEHGRGALHASDGAYIRGEAAWGRAGLLVSLMRGLQVRPYSGEKFDQMAAVLLPKSPEQLSGLARYVASPKYLEEIRKIDSAIKITPANLVKVPFDEAEDVVEPRWPAHSRSPKQWSFAGDPKTSTHPLQAAVATLLGYQWPSSEKDAFRQLRDDDGIVCLPSLRGEPAAAARVQEVLLESFGAEWSSDKLRSLLGADAGKTDLDAWLRDGFFAEHCVLFEDRPFVWQLWDGMPSGFSALVNYHRLAAPNGMGSKTLEKLIFAYLGDWIDRQRADQKSGVEGADARVAAAEHLKRELERILEGEPPYDIFVRWKPLQEQTIGWEPNLNDGVRVNIRPFMVARPLNARAKNACILRVAPKIKWEKDRGKEPTREKADFPWFWGWDESTPDFKGGSDFDGNRWNDLHYTRAAKLAARERGKGGK